MVRTGTDTGNQRRDDVSTECDERRPRALQPQPPITSAANSAEDADARPACTDADALNEPATSDSTARTVAPSALPGAPTLAC